MDAFDVVCRAGTCRTDSGHRMVRFAHQWTTDGVEVEMSFTGAFTESWVSTGIEYAVEVDSPVDAAALNGLLETVDRVAEIPRVIRQGATVRRSS